MTMTPTTAQAILSTSLVALAAFGIFCVYDTITVLKRNLENKKKLVDKLSKQVQTLQANQQQPVETAKPMNPQTQADLSALIAQTKGKFFSITFIKKNGDKRVANGKDFYVRLLKDGESKVREAGYTSMVDRNKEGWICAHNDSVIRFKCGKLEKTITV